MRLVLIAFFLFSLAGQERQVLRPGGTATTNRVLDDGSCVLMAGTRIPLSLMNTVSSRNAAAGDQVYLQTIMPLAVDGHIVIPAGTYVTGTITETKRPGKVKGKGDIAVRFDSLMFPNGSTIDLAGRMGAMDGSNPGSLNRQEGKVTSEGSETRDAMVVGSTTVAGTGMGYWIGGQGSNAAIGAGAGAAAGLAAVLMTRGPDAVLHRGSTVEMLLNRELKIPADVLDQATGARYRPPRSPAPRR